MQERSATLREVIEELAELERGAGSPGEEVAAHRLRGRFERCRLRRDRRRGGVPRRVRAGCTLRSRLSARSPGWPRSRARARPLAALAGAGAAAAIADDCANWSRFARRRLAARKKTWNVVAETGDRTADRTIVVMAHHDAAPTGAVFDDTAQRKANDLLPDVIEAIDTAVPMWWPVIGGPALSALGAVTGRRGLAWAGLVLVRRLGGVVRRHRPPPDRPRRERQPERCRGAGVDRRVAPGRVPSRALRVVLVSCGAEEVLQGGVYGFVERHLKPLDPSKTWVLNVDTVGSPRLIMLEGEGPVVMEDYCGPEFRDLVARVAEEAGVELRRNMRARTSTDAVIPSHAGYPTATLAR